MQRRGIDIDRQRAPSSDRAEERRREIAEQRQSRRSALERSKLAGSWRILIPDVDSARSAPARR